MYFPYPAEEDCIDYAIIPVNNGMTWVVGPTSVFLVGHLLCVIKNDIMNIILPPAFRLDAEAQDFDWIPHPVHGTAWANYTLVDPDSEEDENFTHMVPIAPSNVFQTDPGDQVRWSTLGIHLISPPHLTYQKDLTQYGQDVASKFASVLMQTKNPEAMAMAEATIAAGPIGMATHLEEVTMESDLSGKTKATEKCQIKSSMKKQSAPVDNTHGEASAPAPVTKAGPVASRQPEEMEATTNITMVTDGGSTSNEPLMDMQTLNQVREMVFRLLNQSKILDKCRVRVAQAVSKAMSKCTTKLLQPFTTYISDVSDAVETWCRKVTLIHPEMAHCDYDTYHACSASV